MTTLPAECNSIVDIITHQPIERQTIDYVIATLVEWETCRQNRKLEVGSNRAIGSTMTSENALNVSSPHTGTRNYVTPWPKRKPRISFPFSRTTVPSSASVACWYCNKKGHRQVNCFTKRRAEQAEQACYARTGGPKRRFPQPDDSNESAFASVKALMAKASTVLYMNSPLTTWLVDSGASHHMCSNIRYCSNIQQLPKCNNPIVRSLGNRPRYLFPRVSKSSRL